MNTKIVAVVVTFNRLEKLKKAISAYDSQAESFDDLIIVDNCSSDGTREFLSNWKEGKGVYNRHVIFMDENLGGAGGFHDGCEFALTLNPDWIFVADDDAYPDKELITRFNDFIRKKNVDGISAICGSVLDNGGNITFHHRRTLKINHLIKSEIHVSEASDYQKESFTINVYSYVGTFMKVSSLRKVGLCNREFFIYFDDGEHSLRMSKDGMVLCVPALKIVHDDGFTTEKKTVSTPPLWRSYYLIRNSIYTYLHHYPLAGIARVGAILINDILLSKDSKEKKTMMKTAVKDAVFNKLGKHPFYRPK